MLKNVGTPSLFPWVFRNVRRLFRGENKRYLAFLETQSKRDEWLPKFYAGHELHAIYSVDPDLVRDILETLSGDEKEIVREGAARSWSKLLNRDFDTIFNLIEAMRQSDQYEHRYTAALAPVRYYDEHADTRQQEHIETFWKQYENDDRKGLWNLVRQQILKKRT